jgi:hypothetical protein
MVCKNLQCIVKILHLNSHAVITGSDGNMEHIIAKCIKPDSCLHGPTFTRIKISIIKIYM